MSVFCFFWGFFGFSDPFIVPSGFGSPSTEAQRAAISLSNAARVTARFSYASLVHSHDPPRLRHTASEDADPTLATKGDEPGFRLRLRLDPVALPQLARNHLDKDIAPHVQADSALAPAQRCSRPLLGDTATSFIWPASAGAERLLATAGCMSCIFWLPVTTQLVVWHIGQPSAGGWRTTIP